MSSFVQMRVAAADLLDLYGFTSVQAGDAPGARAAVEELHVGVAAIDSRLHEDGYLERHTTVALELAQDIKQLKPAVRVLLWTCFANRIQLPAVDGELIKGSHSARTPVIIRKEYENYLRELEKLGRPAWRWT